ncbi:peptidase S9, prolyl oligopeptidase active site domain protein [Shewanella sediminis HAW-EB3]|uniref:Peptidase S9, prolyl oligopeptidase active site domain protein n=1 Tax=Shewanella sediminis (strain HAW-EB3) TaxID=425104 RepID=A8FQ71_SHESH|nr:S9 family peptidase [Shewanella sediminis]ABV34994.1 peptidase S9, prolyl oligopeptidase active site domain protein [Shewanella sediminis HAW-EB3]
MKLIKFFSFACLTILSYNAVAKIESPAEVFSRSAEFSNVKISPGGDYLSTITTKDGKQVLIILDAKTRKPLHSVYFSTNAQVGDYQWVNDERVVLQKVYLKGWQDHPLYYGELMAVNADGSKPVYLFGYAQKGQQTGTRIKKNTPIRATAYILDPMPENKRYMLVKALPWGSGSSNTAENLQQVYRVDVYKGKRKKLVTSPISYANFLTDDEGEVRFVSGTRDYINSRLFYREDNLWVDTDKLQLNLEQMRPIAFGDDKDSVYVVGSEPGKNKGIYLINIKTGTKKLVSRDDVVDPYNVWINQNNKKLYAVEFENGYPSYEFVDKQDARAKLIKQLLASLPGHQIHLVSETTDANQFIIKAFNDRNPGDYYLFNTETMKLEYLVSQKNWLDPELMAEVKPISFTSRDGKKIHGYLTLPNNIEAKNLPLVVNPHGGPHGPRDWWGFDAQNQLIASQGAAILQINFRGSGGYGKEFEHLGHQKWGTDIQYDIIDGTKYVIEQGLVDKDRICIAGGSFGGYSALMAPTLAPDMFKCAIGFAGVYDLPLMFKEGDVQSRRAGERYLEKVLGEDTKVLQSMSPTHNVDKLKTKLLLVHGGDDERAPIEQFEALEDALNERNYPYQKLIMDDEGHGFYNDDHQAKYYGEMLSFLKENLKL